MTYKNVTIHVYYACAIAVNHTMQYVLMQYLVCLPAKTHISKGTIFLIKVIFLFKTLMTYILITNEYLSMEAVRGHPFRYFF